MAAQSKVTLINYNPMPAKKYCQDCEHLKIDGTGAFCEIQLEYIHPKAESCEEFKQNPYAKQN